ncbi:MAG TPA: hypothetical protein VLE97_08055 [Gaiellaceae bacterium]|nr:hypothetical protein [Gaiellaceae bacterium]
MAALSATILSVSFLLAALIGVDVDAPGWFTIVSLMMSIVCALTVASAIASDTASSAAERRRPRGLSSPSDN